MFILCKKIFEQPVAKLSCFAAHLLAVRDCLIVAHVQGTLAELILFLWEILMLIFSTSQLMSMNVVGVVSERFAEMIRDIGTIGNDSKHSGTSKREHFDGGSCLGSRQRASKVETYGGSNHLS